MADGYRRVQLLRRTVYAREAFEPGAIVTIDDSTAAKWIAEKIASDAPSAAEIWTRCPRCHGSFWIPATVTPSTRWTQCKNPHCTHGWYR
jgi:hypothetical protein